MGKSFRSEHDFLGQVKVPSDAYYGAFTARANANFQISGEKAKPVFICALAKIKISACEANRQIGILDARKAKAIEKACREVIGGKFSSQFILDVFQAGAGTPFNMNMNEVIANRANEILHLPKGDYARGVNPNNDVNMCQSSNDVIPTATRIAVLWELEDLHESVGKLEKAFRMKAKRYSHVIKPGRTHLQDAVPITYGQVFTAYADALHRDRMEINFAEHGLLEIPLGGTAIGTGIASHPQFKKKVVAELAKSTGLPLKQGNSIELTQNFNPFVQVSGSLRSLALSLIRISRNLQMLSSGPRTGLGEILLPEVEPGSSIMPGKVNPSILECVEMVGYDVMGAEATIAMASQAGYLELNSNGPLIAHKLLVALQLIYNALNMLEEKCISGLRVDEKRCKQLVDESAIFATALNPKLGYHTMSKVVRKALRENKTIARVVEEEGLLSKAELKQSFKPENLTRPSGQGLAKARLKKRKS
ncbi:TPA: aspartate ammonia-lyase [Candidatus Micrarchaeota archaeon]|nr:aspartate ammonia-lyase [Candidatus Micrarchaeota archaeon]